MKREIIEWIVAIIVAIVIVTLVQKFLFALLLEQYLVTLLSSALTTIGARNTTNPTSSKSFFINSS